MTLTPEDHQQLARTIDAQVRATIKEVLNTSPQNNDPWLDTPEAAEYLNIATGTLANSRSSGTLLGRKAPKATYLGRKACYRRSVLDQFRAELEAVK